MKIHTMILVLACWRITALLIYEDGPWDIFARFRRFAGVEYDQFSQPVATGGVLGKVLLCPWCLSVWIGLALAPFSEYTVDVVSYVLVALFLSAAAIMVDTFVMRSDGGSHGSQ